MLNNTKNLELQFNRLLRKYTADLTIDNRELMDVLYNLEERQVAAKLMHRILKRQVDSYKVSAQHRDYLKEKKFSLFPVMSDSIKQVLSNTEVQFNDSDEDAEDKFWRLCKTAFATHDHILIGHEMQLTDYQISTYDAICGTFRESYNPRMLNVAREFSSYLKNRSYIEKKVEEKDGILNLNVESNPEWETELKNLYDKYNAHPLDEDKAISYLLHEVLINVLYAMIDLGDDTIKSLNLEE